MMYVVYNKYHIHRLMNISKMLIFAYNSDRMVYGLKSWTRFLIKDTTTRMTTIFYVVETTVETVLVNLTTIFNSISQLRPYIR